VPDPTVERSRHIHLLGYAAKPRKLDWTSLGDSSNLDRDINYPESYVFFSWSSSGPPSKFQGYTSDYDTSSFHKLYTFWIDIIQWNERVFSRSWPSKR
jgi:hypothetical protein